MYTVKLNIHKLVFNKAFDKLLDNVRMCIYLDVRDMVGFQTNVMLFESAISEGLWDIVRERRP